MRTFALATLAALTYAGKVHEFFAESNYICELCQQVVDYTNKGYDEKIDQIFALHPALQTRINAHYGSPRLFNMREPLETCRALDLCETPDIYDMLTAEMPIDLHHHINLVNNNPRSTWTAGVNDKFEGASLKEVRQIMGTIVDPEWTLDAPEKHFNNTNADLPETFDARTQWPECESVINHVRDQANCGSCWAHGTTEALNDRLCIASGGSFTTLLSVSDTTACCNALKCGSFGCNGGQVGTPWSWFKSNGVVTGGDYGDGTRCYDYTMPKCAHHVTSDVLPSCDDIETVAPQCLSSCPSNTAITWADDKHTSASSYNVRRVDNIKQEIMTYGTVTAAFTVYEDFLTYKSGVYTHQTGSALGGHAIKTIGWGTEDGVDYWLCVNSWNDTWGDQGTFKIKMGECGINNQMHAGLPGQ